MIKEPINIQLSENELKFWTFAFEDLLRTLERIPSNKRVDYFIKLYHQNVDYHDIKEEVLKAASYGHNLIIQGVAGSGKTTLVRRYVVDEDFQKRKYHPLYVSTMNANKTIGYVSAFVEKIMEYIEKVKYPITLQDEMKPENIMTEEDGKRSLNNLRRIISELDIPSKELRPLIFFDDLDYAEKEWKQITKLIRDFIADSNITFVFTLRPRLEKIILSDPDDRIRYLYHNTEKAIMIIPNIIEIILNRIHIIINPEINESPTEGTHNIFAKIYNFFHSYGYNNSKKIFKSYLKDIGIDNVDEVTNKIRFPFHDAYLDFMKKITGLNLRRLFLIAKDSILFLRQNSSINLEDNKSGFWEINIDIIAKLFMKNPESTWNFLDINEKRLSNDVSLYYSILHILHNEPENEIQDEKAYKIIKKKLKKVTISEIKTACQKLAGKEWTLIDFTGHYDSSENKYRLNKKGLYYLEVSNWPQYQKAYGYHNYTFEKN